jgi:hypothetical protein
MYVFGMDLPLMEILFVFSILYLAGLVFTFLEIRKLRKLILVEQKEIKQLDEIVSKKKK